VVSALGLKMADLMPPSEHGAGRKANTAPRRETATYPTVKAAIAALEARHGPRGAFWTYSNTAGEPVGVVVRWNRPDGGKDILPVSKTAGGWIVGGMPEPRPLYRLPELLARPGERVYVAEGEKAADATRNGADADGNSSN
jgi:putative DNA primase/helicase